MTKRKRCAIYTRKSTEEGLEQDFNSLDAQKEACSAYILSQAAEGWEEVKEHYDDGGWSGGRMDRPALTQLLADVETNKVDIIVVYKVDRLTRSLVDFAKIVDILDEREASFVSVTQAFNTTNSMGRLTLNVLLSFAQFEREVTSERIRDKIAASKKKGIWMGGPIPLGYALKDRALLIDPIEAKTIRFIFDQYCKLQSIQSVADAINKTGTRTKKRIYKDGRQVGGIRFRRGMLAQILQNPIYVGEVRHKGVHFEGQHDAIISSDQFNQVAAILKSNGQERRLGKKARNPSLLAGLLSDPDGRAMTPIHTTKPSKRYRYYVTRFKADEQRDTRWSVPAGELEKAAIGLLRQWLRSGVNVNAEEVATRSKLADDLEQMPVTKQRALLLDHKLRFQLTKNQLILFEGNGTKSLSIAAKLVSRGSERKLQLAPDGSNQQTAPDPVLLTLVAKARAAQRMVLQGTSEPAVENYSKHYLTQLIRISWLAPDITTAIIEGRQPVSLTGRRLLRASALPLDWTEQRAFLGFD